MRPSTNLFHVATVLALLASMALLQAQNGPPTPPSDFSTRTPPPEYLPRKLDIQADTRIEVQGWKKGAQSSAPVNPNSMRLAWNPFLESATIEKNDSDIHAIMNWEGGRSSEVFVIKNTSFRISTLSLPDLVETQGPSFDFQMSNMNTADGASGDFPGITWYSPSTYIGTAEINGDHVLVFSQTSVKPGTTDYPAGGSICLDAKTLQPVYLDDGVGIYMFTYSPAPNVQINPQGPYLKAILHRFHHYP